MAIDAHRQTHETGTDRIKVWRLDGIVQEVGDPGSPQQVPTEAAVRAAISGGGGGSGSITASGYTQNTARLLGRTTASSGAIEEITVGSGLSFSAGNLAASGSAGAKTLITETVTSGSQATVTFSSIPNTYRDLEVVVRGRGNVSATSVIVRIQFNGDTGANYDFAKFDANGGASGGGSGGQSVAQTSADFGYLTGNTGPSNAASSTTLVIYDYKGTTFTKNGRSNGNLTTANSINNQYVTNGFIAWRSTSAITQIDVSLSSSTFVDGSVVSLYGVF